MSRCKSVKIRLDYTGRKCLLESMQLHDSELECLPQELQSLKPYLRINGAGKNGKAGTYFFRVSMTLKKALSPRRYDFGLKTRYLAEALKRAGELVALCFFCGAEITSKGVNAPALASLFPLTDLSDDLGRDREDEEDDGFTGGNAGLPFFIRWASDTPPHRILLKRENRLIPADDTPATGKRKSPGGLRVGKKKEVRNRRQRV